MVMTVFQVLGGLAVFMFGLGLMTDGLRQAAGERLRGIISRATRNRANGLGLGTLLGFLMHSSAAMVMFVGFTHAGLMTLAQSVPLMLGANIGTTLSMQLVSFRLGDYAWIPVAIGFLLRVAGPRPRWRHIGTTLLGFGLLFLGMTAMSGAIAPHREALSPLLARIDGSTLAGMLLGVLISALVTGVIQSSGATIGMCFVLIKAGVITSLPQVYPIVLGAHVGTCVTALLASIGTSITARRCAISHLLFNLFNVALAIIAAPLFMRAMEALSGDLLRQTANLHMSVITAAALLVIVVAPAFARLVERLVPSRHPPPEGTHLDRALLTTPEDALAAVLRELQRMARICRQSLDHLIALEATPDAGASKQIELNEATINQVKAETRAYLLELPNRYLSRRQVLFIEDLQQVVNHLERMGDHLDAMAAISRRRQQTPAACLESEARQQLDALHQELTIILDLLIESFSPDAPTRVAALTAIEAARQRLHGYAEALANLLRQRIAEHLAPPIRAILISEYLGAVDRLANHATTIASFERHRDWRIKARKLGRQEPLAGGDGSRFE